MPTLTDILTAHGVLFKMGGTHHHVRDGWLGVDCPRCSPCSGRFRLGFTMDGKRANCWSCGRADPIATIADLCRVDVSTALRLRSGLVGDTAAPARVTGRFERPRRVEPLGLAHKQYLRGRGFDPQVLSNLWGIEGIGPIGDLAWRLFIPVYDEYGNEVTWTTRSIRDKGPRYLSAPREQENINIKEVLYGAHLARRAVIVVEGPLDAWAIGPGAVAVCGTAYSAAQASLIAAYPYRAVCFDTEPAAQYRASVLCATLSAMPGRTTNIELESGKDPATATMEELMEIRSEFLPEFA